MKRLIPQFGDACLESRGDAFITLARSIVGQQISVKAAQAVWDRFARLPSDMTPDGDFVPEGKYVWTGNGNEMWGVAL